MRAEHRRAAGPAAALKGAGIAVVLMTLTAGAVEARPLSILSLDQCADQYVLAMARPGDRLVLSPRADDDDSALGDQARGHRQARPGLEAAVMSRPDVVVRSWGGDPALMRALARRGVPVIGIGDPRDLGEVEEQVRRVAGALGRPEAADPLVRQMAADMHGAREAARAVADRRPEPRRALYLTAGGFTAGPGTLIDAMMRAAGLSNAAATPGFGPVSVEGLVMAPPARFVLGFFDSVRRDRRGSGRHPALARRMAERPTVRVPAAEISCPTWFAARAARRMAEMDG